MDSSRTRSGVLHTTGAMLWWGVAPLYFKAVDHVPALEVLAHRIAWSFVILAALLAVRGRLGAAARRLRDRRVLVTQIATTLLISTNWLIFIWAVANERLVEASLGYFIGPFVNVVLGTVVLRERPRKIQWLAVLLVLAGVGWLARLAGSVSWIALALAVSFSLYGLLRKRSPLSGVESLASETAILAPLAVAWLAVRAGSGEAVFIEGPGQGALLALAGPVTAVPLVWFTAGAQRISYIAVGMLQYLAPSCQFLMAVLVFGEPFLREQAGGYIVIWLAVALYLVDLALAARRGPAGPA